jgi:hypothetical protein
LTPDRRYARADEERRKAGAAFGSAVGAARSSVGTKRVERCDLRGGTWIIGSVAELVEVAALSEEEFGETR